MTVEILRPHGFCQGVAKALAHVGRTLAAAPATGIYCLHEIVHNDQVVAALRARGVRFVDSVASVPPGATLVFSAHGVSPAVRAEALGRHLAIVDATCPYVAHVHACVRGYAAASLPVVIVGHRDHVEVRGVCGEVEALGGAVRVVASAAEADALDLPDGASVGVVTQTTLVQDDVRDVCAVLEKRFRIVPRTAGTRVCTATQDRQNAVRAFVRSGGDGVLVLGSAASSNTRRLVEVARRTGAAFARRIADASEIGAIDFTSVRRLALTSGASTPETVFDGVFATLTKKTSSV